jgi:hypothetical protein
MPKTQKEEIKNLKQDLKSQRKELDKEKKARHKALQLAHSSSKAIRYETKKQVVTALVAAFGFIIALVWRDAIKAYIDVAVTTLKIPGPTHLILLYTAIITTALAVIGIILVNKWGKKEETKQ